MPKNVFKNVSARCLWALDWRWHNLGLRRKPKNLYTISLNS